MLVNWKSLPGCAAFQTQLLVGLNFNLNNILGKKYFYEQNMQNSFNNWKVFSQNLIFLFE